MVRVDVEHVEGAGDTGGGEVAGNNLRGSSRIQFTCETRGCRHQVEGAEANTYNKSMGRNHKLSRC